MAILPTHKAAMVYLEHCRISVRNGMVTFTRKSDAIEKIMLEKHYSLPYGNINALVLGPGTSTGSGKTRAIALACSAAAQDNKLRYSLCLGLRTLTLPETKT